MQRVIKAETRGKLNFGWLNANYSFSFGDYYNPERIRFGVLRVLNDDYIAPSQGFGTHPHNNMEIITVILEGELAHKDSAGHEHISKAGGIQVMSAGTGIFHSEYNSSDTETTNSLQIWILPDKEGHQPRYAQSVIKNEDVVNNFHLFVGPENSKANLFIHQNAYFSMAEIDSTITYKKYLRENGIYIFVIEGDLEIESHRLGSRDAIELTDTDDIVLKSLKKSKVLLMEVPLLNGE